MNQQRWQNSLAAVGVLVAGERILDASEAPRWWTPADPTGDRVLVAAWPDGATSNPEARS